MKYYRRKIEGMNSLQKLSVNEDKTFHAVWNEELGAHKTLGFTPNEFEVGKKVPHGFFNRFGFVKYKPSDLELEFMNSDSGDFTT